MEIKKINAFKERWKNRGYEKGETSVFWLELLRDVLDIENPGEYIEFENHIRINNSNGFIDAYIPKTKVMIEQKSSNVDLRKQIKQSDNSLLTPYMQAKRYSDSLRYDDRARWIITCNFNMFLIYDMNNPNGEPEEILLENLDKEYYRLNLIIDESNIHLKKEEELSFKAGELVGELYDAFSKEYVDIASEKSQKDLNELCVRVVFCLYAEDANLFANKDAFHDYLNKYDDLDDMRKALIDLFKILDTPYDERDPYMAKDLYQFPYVNGGLFANTNIEIPRFNERIRKILLSRASDNFDWSEISPTIFGAVFESTLNPETRRKGGMHYTSVENIHKVIDPLFLNDLREELNSILEYKNDKKRRTELNKFQDKLTTIKCLDPAAGSGNFLTESYLSLRRLENEVIAILSKGNMGFDLGDTIKVSIQQFHGIEINDFAVKVAKTAMWIAEAQMWTETKKIISNFNTIADFLPLETYSNIHEGNALNIDWESTIPKEDITYIIGNPPFIGARLLDENQRKDINNIFNGWKNTGLLDYVTCWFKKATDYIKGTNIEVAFVATSSICQGEQPAVLWKPLIEENGIKINFAYRSFKWTSEAKDKAAVFCVIVGFSCFDRKNKYIYTNENKKIQAKNINAYLTDTNNVYIEKRSVPICDVPKIGIGNKPIDGGYYIFTEKEMKDFLKKEPKAEKYFKKWYGATEFLNSKPRYCLYLAEANISDLMKLPEVIKRIDAVRDYRLKSKSAGTREIAKTPTKYHVTNMPKDNYLLVPRVSTSIRKYIPIGVMSTENVVSDSGLIINTSSLYDFAILTSKIHNEWVKFVCGRLGDGLRYSAGVVYNNYPWPNVSEEMKEEIAKAGKEIIEVRKKYEDTKLLELYGEHMYLYEDLVMAHEKNDELVLKAYGLKKDVTREEMLNTLMKMYEELTKEENII